MRGVLPLAGNKTPRRCCRCAGGREHEGAITAVRQKYWALCVGAHAQTLREAASVCNMFSSAHRSCSGGSAGRRLRNFEAPCALVRRTSAARALGVET